jgi:RNA polymerase sigma factor (sigma-70 family)
MATAQLGTLLWHIRKIAGEPLGATQRLTDQQLLGDFAAVRSEAAFTMLVSRHGPMVLRVCRRVLNHEQDAEDAFQATFLVLARNSKSIRNRAGLGGWLHGVAYRTAMKVKRTAARRRNHEARLRRAAQRKLPGAATRQLTLLGSPTWDDVQAVLDYEIQRLPERFREAFVLCVLEGKSGREAAAELQCKEGTVKSRVNRARQALQRQLARRGINLAVLLAAFSVAEGASRAAVSATLADSTIRFGLSVAAGRSAAGVIPSHIAALAAGVTRAMYATKTKVAGVILLAAGIVSAACGLAYSSAACDEAKRTQQKPPEQTTNAKPETAKEGKEAVTYSGRVLGPDQAPVPGAKVYLTKSWRRADRATEAKVYATTGNDGMFRFSVPRGLAAKEYLEELVVTAKGFGPAWTFLGPKGKREDLTLRLVNDQSIAGEIVDLQGKPIQGATVRVLTIKATDGEDLGPWLQDAKAKKQLSLELESRHFKHSLPCSEFPTVSRRTDTDAEGRFRIDGVGRERMLLVRLEGPRIATQHLSVFTRESETVRVRIRNAEPEAGIEADTNTYHGASFRYVAIPSKPVIGVIRDRDTKQPLAGVNIYVMNGEYFSLAYIRTKTDAEGRYRLDGLPKGKGQKIIARPPDDQPYLIVHAEVADTPGFEPVTVDFDLKRGVWIEGKVTDKETGNHVEGQVEYFAAGENRNLKDYPGYAGTFTPLFDNKPALIDRKDGSYRVVGLPGPGVLYVTSFAENYLHAPERDDAEGAKERYLVTEPYGGIPLVNYHAVARIDVPKDVVDSKRDITLQSAWTFTGTLLDPDGKPLKGAINYGAEREYGDTLSAKFTVRGFNPLRPRDVFFLHHERGLVGMVKPPTKNGDDITVKMQPGAILTGRLVDEEGKPRAGVELELVYRSSVDRDSWTQLSFANISTGRDGRFRITALLPKFTYRLSENQAELIIKDGLRLGQTKDLGDVKLRKPTE